MLSQHKWACAWHSRQQNCNDSHAQNSQLRTCPACTRCLGRDVTLRNPSPRRLLRVAGGVRAHRPKKMRSECES